MTASRTAIKASTLHVRNYRERMREQGLVKKDVWIRPEYAEELASIEKSMREAERESGIPYLPTQPAEADGPWQRSATHCSRPAPCAMA